MVVSSIKWLETFVREVATVAYCHKEKTFDGDWGKLNLPVFELILDKESILQFFAFCLLLFLGPSVFFRAVVML